MDNYAGQGALRAYDECKVAESLSVRKETEMSIAHLERQLEIKRQMLKLLDENPAIEKFMDLSRGKL